MSKRRATASGWDEFRSSAPHSSNKWATSDRGWLFQPGRSGSLGNYLKYGPDYYRSDTGKRAGRSSIHAVVYRSAGGGADSRWFSTINAAKKWIERKARKYSKNF